MPISMECPSCMNAFTLPDEMAGRKGKCPECQFTLFVPRASAVAAPPATDVAALTPIPKKKPRNRGAGGSPARPVQAARLHYDNSSGVGRMVLLVAVVVLVLGGFVLLSGGVAAWYLYNQTPRDTRITATVPEKPEVSKPQSEPPAQPGVRGQLPRDEPPRPDNPAPKTEPPRPDPMPMKPAHLTVSPLAPQTTRAGTKTTLSVRVVREECQGDVRLSLVSTHPTIQVRPDATIPADTDHAAIPVTVDSTAPPGVYEIRVTAALGAVNDTRTMELKIEMPPTPVVDKPPPADQGTPPLKILNARIHLAGRMYSLNSGAVESVALSGDAKWALSGDAGGVVRLWELDKGQAATIHEGRGGTAVSTVTLSPDRKWAASGDVKGGVYLHNLEKKTEQLLQAPNAGAAVKDGPVNALEFSPKSDLLLVAGKHSVTSWDVATGKQVMSTAVLADSPCVHFTADGASAYALAGKGLAVFDPHRVAAPTFLGEMGKAADYGATLFALYSTKQEIIAVVRTDRSAELQRISATTARPQQLVAFEKATEIPRRVVVADRAGYALTADAEGLIRGWDLDTGMEIFKVPGHKGAVHGLAVSADGRRCVTGGADGTFRVLDFTNEKPAP